MGQGSCRQVLDPVDKTAANDKHINLALFYRLRDYSVDMSREGASHSQILCSLRWCLLEEKPPSLDRKGLLGMLTIILLMLSDFKAGVYTIYYICGEILPK